MVGPLEAVPAPRHLLTPRPVPSVDVPQAVPGPGVTDEDRNRYGVLLDHAAERGLLSPSDYQVRLAELAEATTLEEMQRIVTELPVFAAPPAKTQRGLPPPATDPVARAAPHRRRPPGPGRTPDRAGGSCSAALVVVLIASVVVLALLAAHLTHVQSLGLAPHQPRGGSQWPSPLRNCSSSSAISSPLGRSDGEPSGVPSSESIAASSRRTMSRWSGLVPMSSSTWVREASPAVAQRCGVEDGAGHRAQPFDEGGAGLGIGHGRHVVGDPGPQPDDRDPGLAEGDLESGLDPGRDLEGAVHGAHPSGEVGRVRGDGRGQSHRSGVGGGRREGAEADHPPHLEDPGELDDRPDEARPAEVGLGSGQVEEVGARPGPCRPAAGWSARSVRW